MTATGAKTAALLIALALAAGDRALAAEAEGSSPGVWHVTVPRPASFLQVVRDPVFAGERGSRFYFGCGLFRLDGSGEPRPDLARRATAREGGRVWDVTLRPALRLADGSALDAFAFVRLWTSQIPARHEARWLTAPFSLPPVALDAQTVRFRLNAPRPEFRRRLGHPWLALMDPHAEPGDRSSLGPFRLLAPATPGAPQVHLGARADHHHGLDLPGDLIFRKPVAGEDVTTYCAEHLVAAWLVFSAAHGPPAALGQRLTEAIQRLQGARGRLAAGGGESGPRRDLGLLLPADDAELLRIADSLQAALVDEGLRLRLERVDEAALASRLRAGLFTVALVRMPATVATALDMEARLAATGAWGGDAQAVLDPVLRLPRRRQERWPYRDLLQPAGDLPRQLPVRALASCRSLPAGAAAHDLLPWLTPLPVHAFRRQHAGVTP